MFFLLFFKVIKYIKILISLLLIINNMKIVPKKLLSLVDLIKVLILYSYELRINRNN